jgi:quercetin dioxygenase-like cupin family protein
MSQSEKVGGRVVFENDAVRVWDDTVGPGETQHLHTHTNPYLAVAIAGETAETIGAGSELLRTYEITPGEVFWFGPDQLPATHALRNTGSVDISVIIVELL